MCRIIEIRQAERFARWFGRLRDRAARARIQARIDHARFGNLGDATSCSFDAQNPPDCLLHSDA